MTGNKQIRIAAAIITRSDGQTLLVRKAGTSAFMQPGGKMEPAESAGHALCRELHEELALSVEPDELLYLGQYSAVAANEPGNTVVAEVFHLRVTSDVFPAAEIEDAMWVNPDAPGDLVLAPLTRDLLLPLCAKPPIAVG
ncbi:NUDIX hydrolase [Ottowia thiooxydans]|uniref:8-oxo-dGTP diphosphatase n=1 Tax=Ottowia thiooxydans TaxID=219182 RepID=A0ABV2Q4L2_9BURK